MSRLILFALAVIVVVIAVTSVQALIEGTPSQGGSRGKDKMPEAFRTVAYLLLLLLMLGITTGWLGGL